MHSPHFRLVTGAFLSLALALVWVGHDPLAGEPKKQDDKKVELKATPAAPLPPVFAKEQPESLDDLKAIEAHVIKEVEKISPAVVGIRIGNHQGSGIIVTKDGIVLTAGHVASKNNIDAIVIMPNGKMHKAKTLGINTGIDSGMIKISTPGEYPFIEMGRSEDLKKGSWVMAIGHPGGFRPNRTPVVRLGRVLATNEFEIRSDCTIVGGDSGGPLFDMNGKVVGIHSRIGPPITANIHVPIKTFRRTWDKLAKAEMWGGPMGTQALVLSPGGKIVYEKEAKITSQDAHDKMGPDDPREKNNQDFFAQVHTFKMAPGSAYTVEMTSPDSKKLDPFLRLEDSTGKEVAHDDDGAGNQNARIVYRPSKEDEYRIVATTFDHGQAGPYKLTVRQFEIKPIMVAGKSDVLPILLNAPRTVAPQVADKLTKAGVPLCVSGFLKDENGKPVSGKSVQFRWLKGETQVKTDELGGLRLQLSKDNIRNLLLEVPEGLKFALELTDNAGNPVPPTFAADAAKESVKGAGGKLVFEEKGQIADKDPRDKIRADMQKRGVTQGCFFKVHTVKLEQGATYTFDLESKDFDAYLRIEDPSGKQIAEDDDSAGNYNSRIVTTVKTDGIYRLIVTTCDPDQYGSYRLAVHLAEAKKSEKTEKIEKSSAPR